MNFSKYKISGKVWSLKYEYDITDEHERSIMTTSGKMFSLAQEVDIKDENGIPKFKIKQNWKKLRPTYSLSKGDEEIAVVTKRLTLKPKIEVKGISSNFNYEIRGNLWLNDYRFLKDDEEVAIVSRDIWKLQGSYGIAIKDEEPADLILAVVIVIELIRHSEQAA